MIEYSSGGIVLIQKLAFYRCKIEEHYFMSPFGNHIANDSCPNDGTIHNYYPIMSVTQCDRLMTLNQ
jgi:hypothetical protein